MAKRLCKMNRKQIAENLGDIHRLVVEPKFVCRSCARSSADNASLCKPAAIPPQACQNKPLAEQKSCGLLAEALPPTQRTEQQTQAVRRVVEKVKQKAQLQKVAIAEKSTEAIELNTLDLSDEKAVKKANKALKKQFKQQKKLLKLAKKQNKLLKRQKKLEASIEYSKELAALMPEARSAQNQSSIH